MDTATLISLDEYLHTTYAPDMEFVDGVLASRNSGTQLHGLRQLIVGSYLRQFRKTHRINVFTETRLLVDAATGRHRIPDVMAVAVPYERGRVVKDVPVIVIEIKSAEDTIDDIIGRCQDYENLGVPNILVMDPDNKQVWRFRSPNLKLLDETSVELAGIAFPFAEMFAELDEL